MIYDEFAKQLSAEGHLPEASGLDQQCRAVNQPFYVPVTNRTYPEMAFFEAFGTKTNEIERFGLDPMSISLSIPESPENPSMTLMELDITDAGREKYINLVIDELKTLTHGRRIPIRNATLKLITKANLDAVEAEALLQSAVGHHRHLQRHVKESLKWAQYKRVKARTR